MNQKYEGGGFKFCPDASPSDGYLDVIVVDSLSKPKVICCLPTAFFGKHYTFKWLSTFFAVKKLISTVKPDWPYIKTENPLVFCMIFLYVWNRNKSI